MEVLVHNAIIQARNVPPSAISLENPDISNIYLVTSCSKPNVKWTVKATDATWITCNCPQGSRGKLCKHVVAVVTTASSSTESAIFHALGASVGSGSHSPGQGFERLLGADHTFIAACRLASTIPDEVVARLLKPRELVMPALVSSPQRVAAPTAALAVDSPGTSAARTSAIADLQAIVATISNPTLASRDHVYVVATMAKTLRSDTQRRVSSLAPRQIIPINTHRPSLANVNPTANSSQRGRDAVLEGGFGRKKRTRVEHGVKLGESEVPTEGPPLPFVTGGARGRPPLPKALGEQAAYHTAAAKAAQEVTKRVSRGEKPDVEAPEVFKVPQSSRSGRKIKPKCRLDI